jgi:hypothetical protein
LARVRVSAAAVVTKVTGVATEIAEASVVLWSQPRMSFWLMVQTRALILERRAFGPCQLMLSSFLTPKRV